MGKVRLSYTAQELVDRAALLGDIERGMTFARYVADQVTIPVAPALNRWVEYADTPTGFELHVDDDFLLPPTLTMQRLVTSFLFNCLDFGTIRLESVDLGGSGLRNLLPAFRPPLPDRAPWFGTVLKPYFHLDVAQRVDLLRKYHDLGLDFTKEDECFIVPPEISLKIAKGAAHLIRAGLHYVPNVTGFITEQDAVERLTDLGIDTVLVNPLVVGLHSVRALRQRLPQVNIWTHRVGYEALSKHITVQAFTQLAVLAGSSLVHIGTPTTDAMTADQKPFAPLAFGDVGRFRPVFTKLTPETLAVAHSAFGPDGVYLSCGYLRDPLTGELDPHRLAEWSDLADRARAHDRTVRVPVREALAPALGAPAGPTLS